MLQFLIFYVYNECMMDFIIIGGLILFALFGLLKGGAKILLGIFTLVLIMIASAFISSALCPVLLQRKTADGIEYTGMAHVIMDPIGNALPSGDGFSSMLDAKIVLGPDEVLYVGEECDVTLKDAISKNIPVVGQYIASFAEKMASPGTSLRNSISYTVARFLYEIVIWVVLVIVLAIVRNILRKKIFRWLDDKKHATMSKVDRVIGLVINVLIFLVIIWGIGALVARFDDGSNWANSIDAFFLNGPISKAFMSGNPFLKMMHITLPVGESM